MILTQNNLAKASSPYLRQHAENPVWWQEWTSEVLDHARRENKPIFVSVGYATCHWCHVMAAESFQDPAVAAYLNDYFVSIKVDREQRPDIDRYLMAFISALGRPGGWPLNCFLTPDLKPLFALTYAPLEPRYGMPGFLEILRKINDHYRSSGSQIAPFLIPMEEVAEEMSPDFGSVLESAFDPEFGGFGEGAKFPPHSTLLFMLYYCAASKNEKIERMLEKTLDSILLGGLHDHLQGGFFRYCIGREWAIPHFEKMLYDQAMLLWVFSLAFRILRKEAYRMTVVQLLKCLQETFEERSGLYYSGHDADTEHEEGTSYLWSQEELSRILTPEEYAGFTDVYRISAEGNFEGQNHLLKSRDVALVKIEKKLLVERNKRRQPLVDKKIITSWNCLVGIGLIHAYRYVGAPGALEMAEALAEELLRRHYIDGRLAHSSLAGKVQPEEFLQDYAVMLLLFTYLHEETGRRENEIAEFSEKVSTFRKEGGWMESFNEDFFPVAADSFDHPVPASVSVAELALLRADILLGRDYTRRSYRTPLNSDFYNVAALMANGFFHVVETPVHIAWDRMPANSLQKRGAQARDCFQGSCRALAV